MKLNKLIFALLVAFALLFATSCAIPENVEDSNLGMEINKEDINEEENIHLRDKNLLYGMWDDTEVVTMYLTVSYGNEAENTNHTWEEINTYSVYDYDEMGVERYKVAGLLQVGDENGLLKGELGYGQVSPNCTVQIRGQTSSQRSQKNYKIRLKENKGEWRGQRTIALNKHQSDGIRIRNKIGFDLLSEIDELMSLRTTFVHLYVKDLTQGEDAQFEDYGLYTQVEQLNKTALETHGLGKNGHLYKINVFEFYRYEDIVMLKDDPNYNEKAFEEMLETKGDDDHTKLISMLDKINDYSIPIEQILEDHFDIENITYWMAFHILMGNIDTQSRNFYIYSPLNVDRWYILSWDNDAMLKATEDAIIGRSGAAMWECGISNYWGNVFFQRCLKSQTFLTALDDAINELLAFLPQRTTELAEKYSIIAKPYLYDFPDNKHSVLTPEEYDVVLDSLDDEILNNYQKYLESLKTPMPFYIGLPYYNDSELTVEWEASYDFNSENITYTFELARDYSFENPIIKHEGLYIPIVELGNLSQGQYFMRVTATNESGYSQHAFDYYYAEEGKISGTRCFYVNANGEISGDAYED